MTQFAAIPLLPLVVVVVLGVWPAQRDVFNPMDHPAALAAWAAIRCHEVTPLPAGLARAQLEDLMSTVAELDRQAAGISVTVVCEKARESLQQRWSIE